MRAMLDAAVTLFSEEGYASVSTRRIAEVAGCSETLLFRYFGGKRGLLLAICNELIDEPTYRPEPADFIGLRDFLENYFLFVFKRFRDHAPRLKVIGAVIVSDPELAAEFEQRHDNDVEHISSHLRAFQETGEIAPDVDIRALAAVINQTSFSIGLLMQIIYGKPEDELDAIATTFARAIANGVVNAEETAIPEPWRREMLHAARGASTELSKIIGLLDGRGSRSTGKPKSK